MPGVGISSSDMLDKTDKLMHPEDKLAKAIQRDHKITRYRRVRLEEPGIRHGVLARSYPTYVSETRARALVDSAACRRICTGEFLLFG